MPKGFGFSILQKSKRSAARLGLLATAHGTVETPAIVPVATQAAIKALPLAMVQDAGSQLLICNTLHLHLRPGAAMVKKHGGLHAFMQWDRPLFTDSGGYQVFSLGFGKEMGIGKVTKESGKAAKRQGGNASGIALGQRPKGLKITEEGVLFKSYLDGSAHFIGPKESMAIQRDLGADVIFAFDECPPPSADHAYMRHSMERTHRWAKVCREQKLAPHQALYGIVQGGGHKDLRRESAKIVGAMPFDGFGIGGEFGASKAQMSAMLKIVNAELPEAKPRHLLGIGHPEDILPVIKAGVDTFDCTVPTHYARHGIAFTSAGRVDLMKTKFLADKKPVDAGCGCAVCAAYSRGYISHLFRAKEMTAMSLLTMHNLFFFNAEVAKAREMIKKGKL